MIKSFDIFFIILTLAVFIWGIYKRTRLWLAGKQEDRHDKIWMRIKSLLIEGIGHRRILDDPYPGLLHLFIFFGFLIPFTAIVFAQFIFTLPLFFSRLLSLALDLVAITAVASIILLMARRTLKRPPRLDNRPDDIVVLFLILAILITGLMFEGLRLSVIGKDTEAWAPAGKVIANLVGIREEYYYFFPSISREICRFFGPQKGWFYLILFLPILLAAVSARNLLVNPILVPDRPS